MLWLIHAVCGAFIVHTYSLSTFWERLSRSIPIFFFWGGGEALNHHTSVVLTCFACFYSSDFLWGQSKVWRACTCLNWIGSIYFWRKIHSFPTKPETVRSCPAHLPFSQSRPVSQQSPRWRSLGWGLRSPLSQPSWSFGSMVCVGRAAQGVGVWPGSKWEDVWARLRWRFPKRVYYHRLLFSSESTSTLAWQHHSIK